MIFLICRSFIPELIEPKGLTDEPMMSLPAMHLADVDPIEVHMDLGDRGKRRKDDRRRWQGGVPLIARDRLLVLLQVLTHLALDEALDQ